MPYNVYSGDKARLVVELDGSRHYTEEGIISDAIRGELLNALDLEVIRFGNLEVDRNVSVK